jgi:protein phosphatase
VISEQRLIDVARAANHRVYEASQAPELRGMGTTLVVATFDPETSVVSIANIGDSRGYLFRAGQYEQVTLDHSLVEELLRQGRLTEDEARNHPQRNMVTRALGIGPDIDVDVFNVVVELGDRIVLCSDGLSNEVDNDDVAEILTGHPDAHEAAQALVDAAVANGGRDNVTVVILHVVDDEPAAATVVDDESESLDDRTEIESLTDAPRPDLSADPLADTKRPAKRRRLPFRGLFYVGSILSVVVIAAIATYVYDRGAWYVDTVDGDVAILRGRPGGGVIFDPVVVEQTDTKFDDLDASSQQRIEEQSIFSSVDAAEQLVAQLELANGTSSTTDSSTTGTPTDTSPIEQTTTTTSSG